MLIATATAACALRITGWDRGESDFVHPEAARRGETSAFYHFHPDETTLIHASLALDDPRQPPLTAYGMLPMYLARVVLECVGWFQQGDLDTDSVRGSRLAVQGVRVLSILLSMATLAVMWALTRSLWGERTALVALHAGRCHRRHPPQWPADGRRTGRGLLQFGFRLPWCAAKTPAPGNLVRGAGNGGHRSRPAATSTAGPRVRCCARATGTDDFAYSMAIATGQILRPWSLADTHTTSFLHFWTALWPQGVGWPLTLLLALAWVRAVFRGGIQDRLLALWWALFSDGR